MLRPSDGALARYTRDLTADARAGRLDPIRCRAPEIDRVVDVLLRRDKNNPVLVGEAGVGKTAIAEGLAQRLASGDVPLSLRGLRLLALDHVGLLAGAMYRGQYEERLQGVVEETKHAGDVVLFIDELHNLIGQGTAIGVAMDAANMLKPALARGEFRVLGATTQQEYDRWIRGDPALERRFQPVVVRELTSEETLEILQVRRDQLEAHHHVVIADAALLAAVRLTDLFVTDRRRPDRAIDVLDEACAHAHAVARYSPETVRLIARVTGRAAPEAPGEGADAEPAPELRAEREETDEDTFGNFARDGVAALERLGAELDAMFGVAPPPRRRPPDPAAAAGAPSASAAARAAADRSDDRGAARPSELRAERRAELRRRLMDEGAVVRGHDVARVVGLITGKTVTWVD
ncbi:MAG TPA: AAA family ATPase [Gemmatimonadaceae bacterium]|nr:AAA family ATPase [Gemmatimonadaceae bacterium]